ncbi:hypothetical protein AYO21_02230 [Fonsecaea monophora]|uniref:Major facilitator superfamily (MFS) profile domain-containing protein n=1 Tax=Fonsecaea monophora TaxID=254056 RepID=A0A177FH64_9EURO|nr:hypothetical protein AYO21_02230 [Fonsecaea monophora]OAG43644.1 hypothetical protein AYO21_02230 [Fonsecaea monophora]
MFSKIRHGHWNGWNFFVCWLVSLGQLACGYPSSGISITLGTGSFLTYMGIVDAETGALSSDGNALIGAVSGVYFAGACFGVVLAGFITDRFGRKPSFIVSATVLTLGTALETGSRNIAMFIVARFITGFGAWGFQVTTPLFVSELAPPDLRGLMSGMNGIHVGVGYTIAACIGLGFYTIDDNPSMQWRAPIGIGIFFALLMIVVCLIVPESPRFLLLKGRVEEAKKIVFDLHKMKNDPDQVFAREEFYQMAQQAEHEKKSEVSLITLFTHRKYRKRMSATMAYAFIGQSTGVLVLNNYGPLIYKTLGYDTYHQFIFQCGWLSVAIVFNIVGALLIDSVGRKPLLMIGTGGACASLILEAAMVATYVEGPSAGTNKAGLKMGVAAAYIFLAFFSVGVDVAGITFFAEAFPNNARAKGVACIIFVIAITDLVYLEVAPTAFANIGWKYYLVFIIISGLGVFVIYFLIPETKGVPLEEMAKVFGEKDEVQVFAEDIHIDQNTHRLVVEDHNTHEIQEIIGDDGTVSTTGRDADVLKDEKAHRVHAEHA